MPPPTQQQTTGVGSRGTPVTKNGVTIGYEWNNADTQRWCAEWQDGANTDTCIGAMTQADAEAWLAQRQGLEDAQGNQP